MNERIKELFLKSLDANQEFCYQRFAELIVQECIKEAGKDENGPAYEAVARIARHFGVE